MKIRTYYDFSQSLLTNSKMFLSNISANICWQRISFVRLTTSALVNNIALNDWSMMLKLYLRTIMALMKYWKSMFHCLNLTTQDANHRLKVPHFLWPPSTLVISLAFKHVLIQYYMYMRYFTFQNPPKYTDLAANWVGAVGFGLQACRMIKFSEWRGESPANISEYKGRW